MQEEKKKMSKVDIDRELKARVDEMAKKLKLKKSVAVDLCIKKGLDYYEKVDKLF